MKILIVGSDGVVGHVVSMYFTERGHEVINLKEANVTADVHKGSFSPYDPAGLNNIIKRTIPDAIINCAAIVNQAAEDDMTGAVWINAYLPHLLEKLTSGTHTVVVQRSTDCVFSGSKGLYTLADMPDAKSFYARTKAIGELVNEKDITIRVSLIGPAQDESDGSLLNWFLRQRGEVKGYANAIWTGLTTLEYAKVIELLLSQKAHGLFQAAPSASISKYELLKLFERYFPGDRRVVRVENKRVDKSLVPFWGDYDIQVKDYVEQIAEMKKWIEEHKVLYPGYYSDVK